MNSMTGVTPAQRVSEPSDFDLPAHVTYLCNACGRRGNEIGGHRILSWTRYLWQCPHCDAINDRMDAPDEAAMTAAEEAELIAPAGND